MMMGRRRTRNDEGRRARHGYGRRSLVVLAEQCRAPVLRGPACRKVVDHLLLRFFDFTVEPGKKYKYQVQLVLADPERIRFPKT